MEKRSDDRGGVRQVVQAILYICFKFSLRSGRLFGTGISLDIAVEQFVRIVFR